MYIKKKKEYKINHGIKRVFIGRVLGRSVLRIKKRPSS